MVIFSLIRHVIVRLNPVFSPSKSLLSFSVDKVTTGTYSFVSFILNVALVRLSILTNAGSTSGSASLVALLVITQVFKDTSQLVNGISSVLQKTAEIF